MHDAVAGERNGVPAIGIMTTRFVSAATMMSGVLGAPDFRFVTIEHPISSASHEALAEQARLAVQASVELLVSA